MRKHSLKPLLIVCIALGALGLGLVAAGNIVNDVTSQRRHEKARPLSLSGIVEAFKAFGVNGETLDKIDEFEKALAGYSAAKNNIVIVNADGSVVYKLNDNFLHLSGNTMVMACRNRNAVTMDDSNSVRHWYKVKGLDGMYSGFGYTDMIIVGDVRTPLEDVRYMLDVYDGKNAEANISINCIRYKDGSVNPYYDDYYGMATPTSAPSESDISDKSQYLLWFREAAMDADIEKALGPSYYRFYNYAMNIGGVLLALYWLLAPVYVFLDARRRRAQPLPWALLVLLTNLVGLAVYWIYQAQNAKASPACPACGRAVNKGHAYCPWCASPLTKECEGCGKPVEREWKACPWCGKPVE